MFSTFNHRCGRIFTVIFLTILIFTACSGSETATQATLEPPAVEPTVIVSLSTHTPQVSTPTVEPSPTATQTPSPTASITPTATSIPTVTPAAWDTRVNLENGREEIFSTAGEWVDMPGIGGTYFDKAKGYDVYFDGTTYVDEVNYVVNRIRYGSEKVVLVGLYGALTVNQDLGANLMKQHIFGLTKWRENEQAFLTAGISTESMDLFWEDIQQVGIPEGVNQPAKRPGSRFNMDNPIPAGLINTERIIVHVYRGDQVGPIKYGFGELSQPREDGVVYKVDGADIILYNKGNGVQAGNSIIDIDGERYARYIVIDGTSDNYTDLGTRKTLGNSYELRKKAAEYYNDCLYHYGLLPELAQQLEDSGSLVNESDKFTYFYDENQPYVGAGVGSGYDAEPAAIQLLLPADGT